VDAEPLTEIAGARVLARPAAAADAPALQAVMDAARDYFELTEGAPAAPGAARALLEDAEVDGARRVFLLWPVAGPAPIGFLDLYLHHPEPGVAHVGVLALRPEARGRGLGGALVEALTAALRAEGLSALRASVGDENPAARAFWERAGFGEVGRLEGGVCVLERAIG
jgi:ribosomal protein S18 acetylase RimI-like enzyme